MTQGFYPIEESTAKEIQKNSFGDVSVSEDTPLAQIYSVYGINKENVITLEADGGTSTIVGDDSEFQVSSGTDPAGIATVQTKRDLKYRPGQGLKTMFTAVFVNSAPGNLAGAGFITSENALMFGYLNNDFGIVHARGGLGEFRTLTITAAPLANETATVTIDDDVYLIPITPGTTAHVAYEIAKFFVGFNSGYSITSNGSTVNAQATVPGIGGTFAFSSATATASWVQNTVGKEIDLTFIPRSAWNVSNMPMLDPSKGNVYKIQFQYLGYGAIRFYVEDQETNRFELVHTIKWANRFDYTNVTVPIFKLGWLSRNLGGNTDVQVRGSSASCFIEGKVKRIGGSRSNDSVQPAVDTTLTNILTIRNRTNFIGRFNRVEMLPKLIVISSDTTKTGLFSIYLNATFSGDMIYQFQDETSSVAEVSRTKTTVSGGTLVGSYQVSNNRSESLVVNADEEAPSIIIEPGDTLTIAAKVSSAVASEMRTSITWKEDL